MYKKSYNRYGNTTRSRNRFSGKNRRRGYSWGRSGGVDVSRYINHNPENTIEEKYIPQNRIEDLNINQKIKDNMINKKFTVLTPIQDKSIPIILNGRDLIGIADTGTGKTVAFLIPMINKVAMNNKEMVVIMAPTRELAQQINTEFRWISQGLNIYSVLCIGGTNMYSQRKDIERRHNFLICTPGRLKDVAKRGWVNLARYRNVVIDEMDRMFDMGFQKDIQEILSLLSIERQTLLFSATLSRSIETLINAQLTNPEKVEINQRKSSTNIKQDVVRIAPGSKKIDVLHELLVKPEFTKVIVFMKTKVSVNSTERELSARGLKVTSIHGNKTQSARQKSLSIFKENRTTILLATDVAARGLDIDQVSHVINYDVPATHEDYIHRIGRTGRGENKGIALTFV